VPVVEMHGWTPNDFKLPSGPAFSMADGNSLVQATKQDGVLYEAAVIARLAIIQLTTFVR